MLYFNNGGTIKVKTDGTDKYIFKNYKNKIGRTDVFTKVHQGLMVPLYSLCFQN